MSSGGNAKRRAKNILCRELSTKLHGLGIPGGTVCPVCGKQLNPDCRFWETWKTHNHLKRHTLSEIKQAMIVRALEL